MPLKDIFGQEWAVRILLQNLRNRRVAPVYLFYGPEGAGKESAAFAFAQALVCSNPQSDGDACGECKNCRKVLPTDNEPYGKHPDVYHLAVGVGNSTSKERITVAQVRELQSWLAYAPLETMRKVVVVHNAETLAFGRGEAGNALLKTLEEPPIWAVFVLLAPSPTSVQETIRSRSRTVPFGAVKAELIENILRNEYQLPRTEAKIVARLSGGSIGVARSLVESDGIKLRHELLSVWLSLALDSVEALDKLERIVGRSGESARETARNLMDILLTFYRDVLCLLLGVEEELLINSDFVEQVKSIAQKSSTRRVIKFVETIIKRRIDLRVNISPFGAVENLFITAKALGVL